MHALGDQALRVGISSRFGANAMNKRGDLPIHGEQIFHSHEQIPIDAPFDRAADTVFVVGPDADESAALVADFVDAPHHCYVKSWNFRSEYFPVHFVAAPADVLGIDHDNKFATYKLNRAQLNSYQFFLKCSVNNAAEWNNATPYFYGARA